MRRFRSASSRCIADASSISAARRVSEAGAEASVGDRSRVSAVLTGSAWLRSLYAAAGGFLIFAGFPPPPRWVGDRVFKPSGAQPNSIEGLISSTWVEVCMFVVSVNWFAKLTR